MSDTTLDALNDLAAFEIPEETEVLDKHPDTFTSAVNFGFVGVGQAGGRFAETAWQLGFRKVLAVNTASGDLARLKNLPEERRLLVGEGEGAGKDPRRGFDVLFRNRDRIYDALHTCLGPCIEQVFVCFGAGGGTGSGSAVWDGGENVFRTVRRYLDSLERPDAAETRIGAVVSIPQVTEKSGVLRNAYQALTGTFDAVERGEVTPLVAVDNNRIGKLWPDLDLLDKWTKPNLTVFSMLKAINVLAATDSDNAFDAQDFRSILRSGTVLIGAVDLKDTSSTSLSEGVRKNFERTMLAEGFDLQKSKVGAALAVGNRDVLAGVRASDFEYAVNQLGDLLGKGVTVHRGIYEASFPRLRVYTLVGGLPRPTERLADIERRSA